MEILPRNFVIFTIFITALLTNILVTCETDYSSCIMNDDEAASQPWLATLSRNVGNSLTDLWPVVIISPSMLLANSKTFRAINGRLRFTGNYSISTDSWLYPIGTWLEVHHVRFHPHVTKLPEHWTNIEDDIVLIHLNKPLSFSSSVRPICLPSSSDSNIGSAKDVMLSGWKCLYQYFPESNKSTWKIRTYSDSQCNDRWNSETKMEINKTNPYKNRICGHTNSLEPGICIGKPYFGVLKNLTDNRRTLIGTYNGLARPNIFESLPPVYVSLLTNSIIDWINKNKRCGPNNYTCTNGDCIPLHQTCDGNHHCNDSSDEHGAYCRARHHCTGNQFECNDNVKCIAEDLVCDRTADCKEQEDEAASLCRYKEDLESTEPPPILPTILLGTTGFLILLALIAAGAFCYRRVKILINHLYLNDSEIFEFRQGTFIKRKPPSDHIVVEPSPAGETSGNTDDLNSLQMPYIYDIPKRKFKFGPEIGVGAFGIVYRGHVNKREVAIKVLKKELVDKNTFKAFLVELKIMAFVTYIKGGHSNIVQLIGAYTDEIRDLVLHIAVEYCAYGSLADYLKQRQELFRSYEENEVELYSRNIYDCNAALTQCYVKAEELQHDAELANLNKWTIQIADGMAFLEANRVVHGDLAARNILLNFNLTAKISDFGLSRQIYYYNLSTAIIDKHTSLPWRWMAPEVISNMKMSSKSDVWSFGVTLWEMYTIGSVPYGGINWSPNFVDQLKHGLRLTKPSFANDFIFGIIQDCWHFNPHSRPDFTTLQSWLQAAFE